MNKTGPDLPGYANFTTSPDLPAAIQREFPGYANFTTSPDLPAAIQREFPSCINFALILGLRDKIPKRISV